MTKDFRDWLKAELRNRRISQREFARMTGLSQGGVSRVLSGNRKVGIDFCRKVSEGLNEPLEDILRLADLLDVPPDYDVETAEIAGIFQRLPPEARKYLLTFARCLKSSND